MEHAIDKARKQFASARPRRPHPVPHRRLLHQRSRRRRRLLPEERDPRLERRGRRPDPESLPPGHDRDQPAAADRASDAQTARERAQRIRFSPRAICTCSWRSPPRNAQRRNTQHFCRRRASGCCERSARPRRSSCLEAEGGLTGSMPIHP